MKLSSKRIVAKVLVNLKVMGGLYDSIDPVVGNKRYLQILDYVNLPFHCAHRHKVGHMFEDCTHSKLKRKWVAKNLMKNVDSPIPQVRVAKLKEYDKGVEIPFDPLIDRHDDAKVLDDSPSLMGINHSDETVIHDI